MNRIIKNYRAYAVISFSLLFSYLLSFVFEGQLFLSGYNLAINKRMSKNLCVVVRGLVDSMLQIEKGKWL